MSLSECRWVWCSGNGGKLSSGLWTEGETERDTHCNSIMPLGEQARVFGYRVVESAMIKIVLVMFAEWMINS